MNLTIINGPNLNLLGKREVEVYGESSFDAHLSLLRKKYTEIQIHYKHSNIEGVLIDFLHQAGSTNAGIILNPAGYSHTSVAIRDAIAAINCPVIEVHISNIYNREEYRKKCITAGACRGIITGLGLYGYDLAIDYILSLTK